MLNYLRFQLRHCKEGAKYISVGATIFKADIRIRMINNYLYKIARERVGVCSLKSYQPQA